jgi:3-dehydroquinate dehydratase II
MKIIIINGPNLNLVGIREQSIYGSTKFTDYYETLKKSYKNVDLYYYQSNLEGELINKLHETGFDYIGIILNAGGFTHTSVALGDAVAAITTPVIEVHMSNVFAREAFRHHSYLSKNAKGVIVGFGLESYRLALESLLNPV